MALHKLTSLDKSRSSSRTEKEDTVKPQDKTKSISSSSLYDTDTKEQQPKIIIIRNNKLISNNQNVSSMSMEEVQRLYLQTEIVSLGRIKKSNFQKF